mmetsp:Transcript_18734/g.47868  ORF Transcript_18734/g.47868 Transcript_18734/m.47868 type:complete len:448 (-) Transcript_18734:1955-3298(-)
MRSSLVRTPLPKPRSSQTKANLSAVNHETRQASRAASQSTNMAREAALAFMEADENGDGVLEFHEFTTCIQKLRAKTDAVISSDDEKEMRALFDSIDTDKSGTIEMNAYFLFALDVASSHGCGLEQIFRKYDTSGEGALDAQEFALAIEDLGFSTSFAHDLFVDMDDDNSGTVSCSEINKALKEQVGKMGEGSKKFLTTLAFNEAGSWKKTQAVDARSGVAEVHKGDETEETFERLSKSKTDPLQGPDSDSLREQIREMLHANSLRDSDFYNLLVAPLVKGDSTQPLSKGVFFAGLHRVGYCGPPNMLYTLYKKIDGECVLARLALERARHMLCRCPRPTPHVNADSLSRYACAQSKTGVISFTELSEWMTGRLRRKAQARNIHLMWGRCDKETLKTLKWSPRMIKRELVSMLQRAQLAPLDLVRAWDQSEDYSFSLREFLVCGNRP